MNLPKVIVYINLRPIFVLRISIVKSIEIPTADISPIHGSHTPPSTSDIEV